MNQHEPGTSSSTNYVMDPIAERQNQDLINLPEEACEETSEEAAAVDEEQPYDYGDEWNYFEKKKKPLRAICQIDDCTKVFSSKEHNPLRQSLRSHLKNNHDTIFNRPLSDKQKIHYMELEKSKAKCKHCNKTFCYFLNESTLRCHKKAEKCKDIQDRSEKPYNYGNEWNYFVKKGPLQAICRDKDCKKELQPKTNFLQRLRSHLKKKHNTTFNRPLSDKLKIQYIELENSKAKCKHCNKTFCYFIADGTLRNHKETQKCKKIQSRELVQSILKSVVDEVFATVERQSQESSDLSAPSSEQTKSDRGALDEPSTSNSKPSTSSSTGYVTDPTIKKDIPQSKKPPGLTKGKKGKGRKKEEKAITIHELSISISGNDEKSPSAEVKNQSQKSPGLPDESTEHIEDKAVAIYKRVESVLQHKKSLDSSIPLPERTRIDTDAFDEPGTSSSMGYNMVAECQSKKLPELPVSSPLSKKKVVAAIYTFVKSILNSVVDEVFATVERQSQESSDLSAPSSEQTKSDRGALDDSVMSETETRTLPPFKEL
ncbi:uncharacterized protein [Temnothorax nylanderi]|uniref:uncharacterized protein n=1 Tax=Temnothorax nylanderi TaxID=102681 RepID=UPI003A89498E